MSRVSRIKKKAKGCGSTAAKEGGDNDDGHDDGPNSRPSAQTTPVKRKRELAKKNAAAVTAGGADNESADLNSVDPEESPTKKARGQSKGKERMAVARANEYADSDGGEEEDIKMDALLIMEKEASDTDFD
ncbi:uncharacterized protein BDW70DRAFT_157926 [Aspergillus foveolatus]|uniref:uncharacterized protein n=1 Tax=Aspergillus foveolatus TaxID=210207 RepID=UPI003CCD65E7